MSIKVQLHRLNEMQIMLRCISDDLGKLREQLIALEREIEHAIYKKNKEEMIE